MRPSRALRPLLALAAALLLAPAAARAQEAAAAPGALALSVADDSSSVPIAGARVEIAGVRGVFVTAADGSVTLNQVPAGPRRVQVSGAGYEPRVFEVDVRPGVLQEVEVGLLRGMKEVVLDEVTAVALGRHPNLVRGGFYARQAAGGSASFLTREQIALRRPRQLPDVFRGLRGFTVMSDNGGRGANRHGGGSGGCNRLGWVVSTSRSQSGPTLRTARTAETGSPVQADPRTLEGPEAECKTQNACTPAVYLNGVVLGRSFADASDVLNTLTPEQIEGIEAYPSAASVPAQYNQTGSSCGVILIWTS